MARGADLWWAVVLPALVVGTFEFVRHSFLPPALLPPRLGDLLAALLVGLFAALYVGLAARYIRKVERRLSAAREETAVLQERDRIAREMHDSVSQALFYLGVRLQDLEQQVEQGNCDQAVHLVREVRQNTDETYRRVRTAIADLRQHPSGHTLDGAFRRMVADFSSHFDLKVDLQGALPAVTLPKPVLQQVLGVVQEALVNAAKHAGVPRATVTVQLGGGALQVAVSDEGRGFIPAQRGDGFGLLMMQERAELVGGTLSVHSRPGGGTVVRLEVPLEGGADGAGARTAGR